MEGAKGTWHRSNKYKYFRQGTINIIISTHTYTLSHTHTPSHTHIHTYTPLSCLNLKINICLQIRKINREGTIKSEADLKKFAAENKAYLTKINPEDTYEWPKEIMDELIVTNAKYTYTSFIFFRIDLNLYSKKPGRDEKAKENYDNFTVRVRQRARISTSE